MRLETQAILKPYFLDCEVEAMIHYNGQIVYADDDGDERSLPKVTAEIDVFRIDYFINGDRVKFTEENEKHMEELCEEKAANHFFKIGKYE